MRFINKTVCLDRSVLTILSALVLLCGCQVGSRPRLRVSDYFGNPAGMRFPDANDLGPHCLDACIGEKLGMVYTCKAGFIDIGHLREAADRTYYIANITYENLMQSNTNYSFRVIEPSRYHITFGYPDYWNDLPKHQQTDASWLMRELFQSYDSEYLQRKRKWYEFIQSHMRTK